MAAFARARESGMARILDTSRRDDIQTSLDPFTEPC